MFLFHRTSAHSSHYVRWCEMSKFRGSDSFAQKDDASRDLFVFGWNGVISSVRQLTHASAAPHYVEYFMVAIGPDYPAAGVRGAALVLMDGVPAYPQSSMCVSKCCRPDVGPGGGALPPMETCPCVKLLAAFSQGGRAEVSPRKLRKSSARATTSEDIFSDLLEGPPADEDDIDENADDVSDEDEVEDDGSDAEEDEEAAAAGRVSPGPRAAFGNRDKFVRRTFRNGMSDVLMMKVMEAFEVRQTGGRFRF